MSALVQSVNKRKTVQLAGDAGGVMTTSSSGAASGGQDANELDLEEFIVLLDAIAKYLGKKHRVQLLCLEPATTAPTAPSTMDDEHKTGPAIAVRQKTFIRHKDKRLEPKAAPKEPQSVEELFVKFSAGDSAAQGKRASTMDLNEFIKPLIYLGLLPAKGAAEGKLSKTEATALFKRAQKGATDAREMDGAAFRVVLRLVAEKCDLALPEAEGDEQLAVLLPALKDKPPVSRAARKLTCLKHLSSVGQPQTGQTGNERGEEVAKPDIASVDAPEGRRGE